MSLKLVGLHWFDLSRTALYSPVVMVQVDEDSGHHTSDFYEKPISMHCDFYETN